MIDQVLASSTRLSVCCHAVYTDGNSSVSNVMDEKLWKGEGIRLFGWNAVQEVFTVMNRPMTHRSSSASSPNGEDYYTHSRNMRRRARNSQDKSQTETPVVEEEIVEEAPTETQATPSVYKIRGDNKGTTTKEEVYT